MQKFMKLFKIESQSVQLCSISSPGLSLKTMQKESLKSVDDFAMARFTSLAASLYPLPLSFQLHFGGEVRPIGRAPQ